MMKCFAMLVLLRAVVVEAACEGLLVPRCGDLCDLVEETSVTSVEAVGVLANFSCIPSSVQVCKEHICIHHFLNDNQHCES
jgi:hypothetical protein